MINLTSVNIQALDTTCTGQEPQNEASPAAFEDTVPHKGHHLWHTHPGARRRFTVTCV